MGKDSCYIIHPFLKKDKQLRSLESRLQEAKGLASAMGVDVIDAVEVALNEVKPATYIGRGAIDTFKDICKEHDVDVIIFDCNLLPTQQRNLEKAFDIKVIDRTGLIIEIFGQRAKTREGMLQVDLASLEYQRSRLVRSWTHLERQRGGAGFMGGPGESQIELDRRMIDEQIVRIRKSLEKVKKTRRLQREPRKKAPWPTVALVGYTNAGKSTLFNYLTDANILAKDMLFATLDPLMRLFEQDNKKPFILADTVGFISNLPHELVDAFKATLEEVLEADIILHVMDVSDVDFISNRNDVYKVLAEMELPENKDIIEVWNKVDLVDNDELEGMMSDDSMSEGSVCMVSSISGYGVQNLLDIIEKKLSKSDIICHICLALDEVNKILPWIYNHANILSRADDVDDGSVHLELSLETTNCLRFYHQLVQQNIEVPKPVQDYFMQHKQQQESKKEKLHEKPWQPDLH